jgi:hypothetical protein
MQCKWCRRGESNTGHPLYESGGLPLAYAGLKIDKQNLWRGQRHFSKSPRRKPDACTSRIRVRPSLHRGQNRLPGKRRHIRGATWTFTTKTSSRQQPPANPSPLGGGAPFRRRALLADRQPIMARVDAAAAASKLWPLRSVTFLPSALPRRRACPRQRRTRRSASALRRRETTKRRATARSPCGLSW